MFMYNLSNIIYFITNITLNAIHGAHNIFIHHSLIPHNTWITGSLPNPWKGAYTKIVCNVAMVLNTIHVLRANGLSTFAMNSVAFVHSSDWSFKHNTILFCLALFDQQKLVHLFVIILMVCRQLRRVPRHK